MADWTDVVVLICLFSFVMADGLGVIRAHPLVYLGVGFLGATSFIGLMKREIER